MSCLHGSQLWIKSSRVWLGGLKRMSKKQNPSDFLKLIIGKPVVVKLNSGVDYRGKGIVYPMLKLLAWALTRMTTCRCACVFRWIHEHCIGADGRICQWAGTYPQSLCVYCSKSTFHLSSWRLNMVMLSSVAITVNVWACQCLLVHILSSVGIKRVLSNSALYQHDSTHMMRFNSATTTICLTTLIAPPVCSCWNCFNAIKDFSTQHCQITVITSVPRSRS